MIKQMLQMTSPVFSRLVANEDSYPPLTKYQIPLNHGLPRWDTREREGYKGLGKSIRTSIFQRNLTTQVFIRISLDFLTHTSNENLLIENNVNQVNGKHLDVKEGKFT